MKILLVHKFFNYNGGADVFFFETGRVLKEHGHEVAYFSTNSDQNLPTEWARYFVDAPDFKSSNPLKKISSLASIPYNREAKKKFALLLDDFQPDIIHCFNIMTQISPSILDPARERKIPIVMSMNDYKHICPCYKLYHDGVVCEDCKGGKFYQCLKHKCAHGSLSYSFASAVESYVHAWKHVYDKIDLFLFSSDFMAEKTESFWGRKIPRGKLMNPFKVPDIPSYQSGEYGLYFGRLIDEKGVDVLLRAIEKAPQVPFVIVGNGPQEEELKSFVETHHIKNVEFAGPQWGDAMDAYLANARFVVVPSTWHENFPYVILQAFAAGKPVIGARRGGITEMVPPDRGVLYEATDSVSLANCMTAMWNDPDKCVRMGKQGREYVEREFNDARFYAGIKENYNRTFVLAGIEKII